MYFTLSGKTANWEMSPIFINFTNQVKICCFIWIMLAKSSFLLQKCLLYEALTCSHVLGIIEPIYFEKKKHLHDFWLWRLFYQPNLEVYSSLKKNNHLNGKKKIHRKLCYHIRVWARNFQFRLLGPNRKFLSFGAKRFRGLLWMSLMGVGPTLIDLA